jgi:hypothetical protein
MALLFADSFDAYNQSPASSPHSSFGQKWLFEGDFMSPWGFEDGFDGGIAFRNTSTIGWHMQTRGFGSQTTLIVGAHIYWVEDGGGSRIFEFTDRAVGTSTDRLRLSWDGASGRLGFFGSSGRIGDAGDIELQSETWYFIEAKVVFHSSSGSLEARINGATDILQESIDTTVGGASSANRIRLRTNTALRRWDNFYVLNGSGDELNDFLGPIKIENYRPIADDTKEWTPSTGSDHYAMVNEAPPDGDTSYVEATANNQTDLYKIATPPSGGSILGAQINSHMSGNGDQFRHIVENGDPFLGPPRTGVSAYQCYSDIIEGAHEWTPADVTDLAFGYESQSGTPRITRLDVDILRSLTDIQLDEFVTSTLVLDQSAVAEANIIDVVAGTELELDQDVDFEPFAQSILELLQATDLNLIVTSLGLSPINLGQLAIGGGEFNRDLLSELNITDAAEIVRLASSGIDLSQVSDGFLVRLGESIIELAQEAHLIDAAFSQIQLTQIARLVDQALSRIQLQQLATFVPMTPVRRGRSRLALSQLASVEKDLNLFVDSTLNLSQSVATVGERVPCVWPGVPEPHNESFTKGVMLQGVGNLTIGRSMNLGDISRFAADRILRESRGGSLRVFADPIWPRVQTLLFTVSGVKRGDAQQFLTFVENNLGRLILLTTHEGFQWEGFITNPDEAVIEDSDNQFTISVEFEGELSLFTPLFHIFSNHGLYLGGEIV